jgi:lysylphosphatidylglycerol synthetase-like protein (DUF2156 family)
MQAVPSHHPQQQQRSQNETELLRRYAGPVSHAVLNPPYQRFHLPHIEGFLGYVLYGKTAVVMGDPLATDANKPHFVEAFRKFTHQKGWRTIYAVTSERMGDYIDNHGGALLQFAELLITNPQEKLYLRIKGNRLKGKSNTARKGGVTVREYRPDLEENCEQFESSAIAVIQRWQSARKGYQLFLEVPRLFEHRLGCRWFIAECEGQLVGILYLLKIGDFDCVYTIDLVLSSPGAPNFTNELLILSAMDVLGGEGVTRLSLAVGPSRSLGEIRGLGPLSTRLAHFFYDWANRLVPQHGKQFFWEQFGVIDRKPLFLYFDQPRIGPRAFWALLKTFNFSKN